MYTSCPECGHAVSLRPAMPDECERHGYDPDPGYLYGVCRKRLHSDRRQTHYTHQQIIVYITDAVPFAQDAHKCPDCIEEER